jgi:hypothetical protein
LPVKLPEVDRKSIQRQTRAGCLLYFLLAALLLAGAFGLMVWIGRQFPKASTPPHPAPAEAAPKR